MSILSGFDLFCAINSYCSNSGLLQTDNFKPLRVSAMSETGTVQDLQNEPQSLSVLSIQKVSRRRNVARRGQIWTHSQKNQKPNDTKSKRANVSRFKINCSFFNFQVRLKCLTPKRVGVKFREGKFIDFFAASLRRNKANIR